MWYKLYNNTYISTVWFTDYFILWIIHKSKIYRVYILTNLLTNQFYLFGKQTDQYTK